MNQLRLITSLLTISDPPFNQTIPKWKKSLLPQTHGNKILLLKRSDKVSSYQNHWRGNLLYMYNNFINIFFFFSY